MNKGVGDYRADLLGHLADLNYLFRPRSLGFYIGAAAGESDVPLDRSFTSTTSVSITEGRFPRLTSRLSSAY
jgi:hypothetical protein